MKQLPPSTPPETVTGEIAALISRLHETGQRLEELTSGQIDTVADASGRPFALRRAQESLRQGAADRQAAILDALPARIALLDAEGIVMSVNEGWRRFSEVHGLHGPSHGIGLDYVSICDQATLEGSLSASAAAEAIRGVLTGASRSASIEYPGHSPVEKRWFLMTATPLLAELRGGAVVMHFDITERKRSEAAVKESEQRYHSLFENMLEGYAYCATIFEQDRLTDFTCVEVNSAFETLTGLKDVVGKKVSEILPGGLEANPELLEFLGRVARSGEPEKCETYLEALSLWLSITAYSSDRNHFVAVFDNITARKAGEGALRRSEEEFRALAESMPQMVWITRPDGGNVYFSQQWMDYTGLTLEESLGHGWNRPFHPEDQSRAWDAWRDATTSVGRYSIECRLRRADGVYRWWLIRGVPVRDAAGTILKWFGTCTDIHDLKMAELEIVRSNRVYAMLSGINTLIVRVRDRDELFREACQIAVAAGGFRMSLIAVVDPETKAVVPVASAGKDEGLLEQVAELLRDPETASKTMVGRAIHDKTPVISNDSVNDPGLLLPTRYVESLVRSIAILPLLIADEAVGVFALYSSEVGFFQEQEMKLLGELASEIAFCKAAIRSRDLKKKADEALRASLKEKEALLREVHHRVKNNMQVITSLLRLEANRIEHPTTKTVLKEMQNRILAMAALHEALYRSNNFAQVDLSSYLKKLTDQLARSLAASPGQVRFVLDLFPVGLDLDQAVPCGLIVNELVSNAIKHGFPSGTRGEVRVGMEWAEGGLLRLRVSDDGVGLPANFDARREKSLGLQLVADLARQLGGTFRIGASPEAVFEVTFALTSQAAAEEVAAEEVAVEP